MQASHQGLLDLGNGETSSIAWTEVVRCDSRCEKRVLQIALVCESIQCWTRATVLDVAAKVVVVGLAIAQRLLVSLSTSEKTFDEVNKSRMHLVVKVECGKR